MSVGHNVHLYVTCVNYCGSPLNSKGLAYIENSLDECYEAAKEEGWTFVDLPDDKKEAICDQCLENARLFDQKIITTETVPLSQAQRDGLKTNVRSIGDT